MRDSQQHSLASLRRKLLLLGIAKAARRAEVGKVVLLEIREQDLTYDVLCLGQEAFGRRFDDVRTLIEFMADL